MELLESLRWRYATKKMNGQKIDSETTDKILEAVRLAPSSYGLTPYQILHIQDSEMKSKLLPACYGQSQITDCSSLLVFCAKTDIDDNTVDHFIRSLSSFRGVELESLSGYRQAVSGAINGMPKEARVNWAHRQCYIALGFGLVASSQMGVDSTPMEGFNPQMVDEVLGLSSRNLTSSCILTLGYRHTEGDYLVSSPKFRFPEEELFVTI
jgi:nitroreductase/dihydropteridine reductase